MASELEDPRSVSLPWPLIVIDFEASALGMRSYPIEVGLARWQSIDAPLEVWSTLIRPTDGWLLGGVWNPEAAAVHGIRKDDLSSGMPPADVMAHINEMASNPFAWCDGGSQDDHWLGTLAHAASVVPRFRLADWDMLGGALSSDGYRRMVRWLETSPPPHRAGDDAARLLRAVAVGLGQGLD